MRQARGARREALDEPRPDAVENVIGAASRAYEAGFERGYERGRQQAIIEIARLERENARLARARVRLAPRALRLAPGAR